MMDSILSLENVSKHYKKSGFKLNDVSFLIPHGSIMGLVGENGSGKTTIINAVLNIVFKDSGTIKIFGKEMTDKSKKMREDIGVVFDANSFSGYMTANDYADVMRNTYSRWNDKLFLYYMDRFKLPCKQFTNSFSRGMGMQLAICLALSHRPKLLLLDEATSGLDPVVRDDMLDIFLDFVQDENHSILLSSHITNDLEKIADYITFIHNGSVHLCAKKDDLLLNYVVVRCKHSQYEKIDKKDIIASRRRDYHIDVLMANRKDAERKYKEFTIDNVSIEDIMILMIKGDQQ